MHRRLTQEVAVVSQHSSLDLDKLNSKCLIMQTELDNCHRQIRSMREGTDHLQQEKSHLLRQISTLEAQTREWESKYQEQSQLSQSQLQEMSHLLRRISMMEEDKVDARRDTDRKISEQIAKANEE